MVELELSSKATDANFDLIGCMFGGCYGAKGKAMGGTRV